MRNLMDNKIVKKLKSEVIKSKDTKVLKHTILKIPAGLRFPPLGEITKQVNKHRDETYKL